MTVYKEGETLKLTDQSETRDEFQEANFYGINYYEAENFTDKVLQAVNI